MEDKLLNKEDELLNKINNLLVRFTSMTTYQNMVTIYSIPSFIKDLCDIRDEYIKSRIVTSKME